MTIFLTSPLLFPSVLGAQWTMAGEISSVLAVLMFFNYMTTPITSLLVLKNKQEIIFLFSTLQLITLFIVFHFFSDNSFINTLWIYVIPSSSLNLLFTCYGILFFKRLNK